MQAKAKTAVSWGQPGNGWHVQSTAHLGFESSAASKSLSRPPAQWPGTDVVVLLRTCTQVALILLVRPSVASRIVRVAVKHYQDRTRTKMKRGNLVKLCDAIDPA
jgi:hypothetical protein